MYKHFAQLFLVSIFGFFVLTLIVLFYYFHYKYGLEVRNIYQFYFYISHNILVLIIPVSIFIIAWIIANVYRRTTFSRKMLFLDFSLFLFLSLVTILPLYTRYFARASAFDDITISTDTSWAAGTYNYNNITVNNAATLTIAGNSVVHADATILLEGDGKIIAQGDVINNKGVEFEAATLTINSGSSISADGQGYVYTNVGPGGGSTADYGGGRGAAGASYGGEGGDGNGNTDTYGMPYGSITAPSDLGSAGGTNLYGTDANGGSGGGYIKITVTGELANGGSISASGNNGTAGTASSGGGSGGSVYITADTISGAGTVTADGGDGTLVTDGGAGGGGRIALIYTTANSMAPLSYGGNGYQYGGAGTVYIQDTDDANGDLFINNNDGETVHSFAFQRGATTPTTGNLTVDTITLSNKAFFEVATGSHLRLYYANLGRWLSSPSRYHYLPIS